MPGGARRTDPGGAARPRADPVRDVRCPRRVPRFRSYITVPVRLSDGRLYGTFCAAGLRSDPSLGSREHSLVQVLARAAALGARTGGARARGGGRDQGPPRPADRGRRPGGGAPADRPARGRRPRGRRGAQPVPRRVGDAARRLLRAGAPGGRGRAPRAAGTRAGGPSPGRRPGVRLPERLAGRAARPGRAALLRLLPMDRVLLELSEHDPVEDYSALSATLDPLRAAGLRLAIDDVGAGFSSLRHIVLTAPDVIKLDRSVVAGVAGTPCWPPDRLDGRVRPRRRRPRRGGGRRDRRTTPSPCSSSASTTGRGGCSAAPGRPRRSGTVPASAGATLAG